MSRTAMSQTTPVTCVACIENGVCRFGFGFFTVEVGMSHCVAPPVHIKKHRTVALSVLVVLACGAALTVVSARQAQATAPPGRYAVNGGEVTDTKTGLVWEKDATGGDMWAAAKDHCIAKGGAWRLPFIRELQSIVDTSTTGPAIDPVFTQEGRTVDGSYWSATAYRDPARGGAWLVAFGANGSSIYIVGTNFHWVRCVRTDWPL